MTQLVIDVPQNSDLEEILNLLNRLKLSFTQTEAKPEVTAQNGVDTEGYLSVETIKKLYPNEWVLVASAQRDETQVIGGIVLLHHPSKREMAIMGSKILKNHKKTAHFYTGEFPKMRHLGLFRKISTEKTSL